MEYKDYYKVLGVEKTATADEIKKAYRKLARKYHPDISKEPNAEARMKEVNEANSVLSDVEKRAAYDQLGSGYQSGQEFRPPPDWNAGFEYSGSGMPGADSAEFSEFFANLFGQAGYGRRDSRAKSRGEDHHAKILIDIADTFRGVTKSIALHAPQLDRQGRVVMKERVLNVKIPKGVTEGQHIRLTGQGTQGIGGGPAGDLFLEVHFNKDRLYRLEGKDVYENVSITPWEAALGAEITIPTPSGNVQMKVPPESQSGRKLRLKGRGVPGAVPGDLFVILEVVIPPANTDKARKFYENMATEFPFNPRKNVEG